MEAIAKRLKQAGVGDVRVNEPLKKYTTLKVGGPADLLIQPHGKEGLIETVRILNHEGIPWMAMGRGSNLLVRDGGIRGAVIKLGKGMDQLQIEGEQVKVGAGFSFIKLATLMSRQGLGGLEFAGGIPGTVGGAVYMNAGAHGSDVSRVLESAEILFADGQIETISNEELHFSYRTSILQKERPGICLEATFRLRHGDPKQIIEVMNRNKNYRRETQPLQDACCGSVFRNPHPYSAGRLIEEAGLKGYRIGDAQISSKHANFIVNCGQAKARDVLALIQHIKETVFAKYGVKLETEVEVTGEE